MSCEWMQKQLKEQQERRKRGEFPGYSHCSCYECETSVPSFGLLPLQQTEKEDKE